MASSFPRFLQLPAEIRRLIWKECLPKQRLFEIDSAGLMLEFNNTCRGSDWATTQNWKPPIITRVCRESRAVAWETGWIERGKYYDDEEDRYNDGFWCVRNQWFAPTTDIVAL